MKVNALQVRQSFGKILKKLLASDEPIIIEKGRAPVAVLISLKTFHERFIDLREQKKKEAVLAAFDSAASTSTTDSLKALREMRYGSNR